MRKGERSDMYIYRHNYVYIPGDIYFNYTFAYVYVHRYFERQKEKEEIFYSDVINKNKYFN